MTTKEAKKFIIGLEHKLCDEAIDIFAEENEGLVTKFFEVMTFALKNLVPDIDNNREKCKIDCPFFTSEYRELCKELCNQQNCYQCIVKDYEIMKQNYNILKDLQKENVDLKAKIYNLTNQIYKDDNNE